MAKLTRFEHAVMLAFAVFIAETMVLRVFPPLSLPLALSLLVPVFSEMGAFALNDYLDVEADRRNRRTDRPLVSGAIGAKFALWFSAACLAISPLLALFINAHAFAIALVFSLLSVAYNWKLKDLPLVGNVYIALTMAIPFIFGNFVVTPILSPLTVVLALLGFVAGLAREIIKSVQDMEGDVAARGSRTLPVVIGKRPALLVASALYALFVPLTLAPFALGLQPVMAAALPVAAGDAAVLSIIYTINAKPDDRGFGYARNMSLAAFAAGMLGLLVAAVAS